MGDTAGGNWKNYHLAGESMHVANLYLNNFIKMPPSSPGRMRITYAWILDNHEFDIL
jgi:hypothetical protein